MVGALVLVEQDLRVVMDVTCRAGIEVCQVLFETSEGTMMVIAEAARVRAFQMSVQRTLVRVHFLAVIAV